MKRPIFFCYLVVVPLVFLLVVIWNQPCRKLWWDLRLLVEYGCNVFVDSGLFCISFLTILRAVVVEFSGLKSCWYCFSESSINSLSKNFSVSVSSGDNSAIGVNLLASSWVFPACVGDITRPSFQMSESFAHDFQVRTPLRGRSTSGRPLPGSIHSVHRVRETGLWGGIRQAQSLVPIMHLTGKHTFALLLALGGL